MTGTIGYITGALAGLGLTLATAYAVERPRQAENILTDTQNSIYREIDRIQIGNPGEVIADAAHDIVQRNPGKALKEFDRVNAGLANTPYQDAVMRSSHYENTTDLITYTDHELQEKWSFSDYLPSGLKTKGDLILGLAGLGLGLVGASAAAKRK